MEVENGNKEHCYHWGYCRSAGDNRIVCNAEFKLLIPVWRGEDVDSMQMNGKNLGFTIGGLAAFAIVLFFLFGGSGNNFPSEREVVSALTERWGGAVATDITPGSLVCSDTGFDGVVVCMYQVTTAFGVASEEVKFQLREGRWVYAN